MNQKTLLRSGLRSIGVLLSFMMLFVVGIAAGKNTTETEIRYIERIDTLILSQSEYRDHVVMTEAKRIGVPVVMALAVSHAENWSGDPTAVSSAGAIGIMQIMPSNWQDSWRDECYGDRQLTDVWRNGCLGVRILQQYFEQAGNWNDALRLYNGASRYPAAGDRYVTDVMRRMKFDVT